MYMYIVFQVVDSTDLRDIKYIFKLDDVILDFFRRDCFRQVGFERRKRSVFVV